MNGLTLKDLALPSVVPIWWREGPRRGVSVSSGNPLKDSYEHKTRPPSNGGNLLRVIKFTNHRVDEGDELLFY